MKKIFLIRLTSFNGMVEGQARDLENNIVEFDSTEDAINYIEEHGLSGFYYQVELALKK